MAKTLSELWKTGETVPGSADLVQGGLGIDILNKKAYSKDKYDNIFEIGEEAGGLVWDFDKIYQKGTLITIKQTMPGGTKINQEYISITDNNTGNDPLISPTEWKIYNTLKWTDEDVTLTVGAGADFDTLAYALSFTQRYSTMKGSRITIEIQDGHVIDYYIGTFDLPDVTITYAGSDPLVIDCSWTDDYIYNRYALKIGSTNKRMVWNADTKVIGTSNENSSNGNTFTALGFVNTQVLNTSFTFDFNATGWIVSDVELFESSLTNTIVNSNEGTVTVTSKRYCISFSDGSAISNSSNGEHRTIRITEYHGDKYESLINVYKGLCTMWQIDLSLSNLSVSNYGIFAQNGGTIQDFSNNIYTRGGTTEDPSDITVFNSGRVILEYASLGGSSFVKNQWHAEGTITQM